MTRPSLFSCPRRNRLTRLLPAMAPIALMALLAVAPLLTGCTKSEEGESGQGAAGSAGDSAQLTGGGAGENKLVFVVSAEPPSLDAHRESTFATVHPTAPHYSVLVRVDPQAPGSGRIVGDLARSWDVTPDGRTYTFHLHEGVRFHDGSELTSRDVLASLNKIIDPPEGVVSIRKSYYSMVESVAAPGPLTVVIRLKFATPAFLPALAQPFNYIYSADRLAEDIHWYEKNVMGSGPFRFVSYTPGAFWVGERFDGYFREGLPKLDGFEAIFAPKENIRLQAIRGGRAMIEFRGFSPQGRDDLVRALGNRITVQESPWNCSIFIGPNHLKPPFDDPRVRRALSLALDRWGGSQYLSRIAVVKSVGGVVFPGDPLAMSREQLEQLPGYWPDMERSRAEARRLLREAGVPEGYQFRLHNRGVDQPYKIVGTWVIDQWRQIGLDVEQWVEQTGPFFQTLTQNPPEFDVSIDFNCGSVVNPAIDVSKFISTDRSDANYLRYTDRELDRLYDAQLRETDFDKQRALLKQFEERLLVEQAHYITLFWYNRIVPHRSKVKGWIVNPSHYLNQDLATVYLEE